MYESLVNISTGKITLAELQELLKVTFAMKISNYDIQRVFNRLDRDSDGVLSYLDLKDG